MIRSKVGHLIVSLASVVFCANSLQASTLFTFTDFFSDLANGAGASGTLVGNQNNDGTFTAISGSGSYNGSSISLISNPAGTDYSISPSGFFFYDNLLATGQNPLLTGGGLLFSMAGGVELNIFSNGPGSYTTYTSQNFQGASNFLLTTAGPNVADAGVPEPESFVLLGGGLIAISFFRRKAPGRA